MFSPFPVGYQPYSYQYQPQYQQQQVSQQTKYVEAIPVDNEAEAEGCPMAAGSSGVFFARNDSFIAVKSIGVNGQITFDIYDKRPPAPSAPAFDPSAYVRRDEFDGLVAAAVESNLRTCAKRSKKETEVAE